jgi:phytol kinase
MLEPAQKVFTRSHARKASTTKDFPASPAGMTSTEWRRRLWHAGPGLLPFLLWAIPHRDPISPTLLVVMLLLVCGLAGHVYWRYQQIERGQDHERLSAVAGYALSVLVTFLIFPRHAELGLTVLAVLAFGDGSATLGGLLLGGPKLPWNPRKTWAGLASFLAVGTPLASLFYWGETRFNPESLEYQAVPFTTALCCAGVAVCFAAIAETLPSRINDNIRVGIAAALGVTTMHALLLGL